MLLRRHLKERKLGRFFAFGEKGSLAAVVKG
jgi:hypothetical protein